MSRKAKCAPHGSPLPPECAKCRAEIENAPDAASMTGEARAEELRALITSPIAVTFDLIHKRTEALVGRPVWTHEFASPAHLYEEAQAFSHDVPTINELVDFLPEKHRHKVIPVVLG